MRGSEWCVGGAEAQPEPLANDDAAPVLKRIGPPARRAPPPVFFSVHHGPSQDPSSAAPELLRIPTHVQEVCAASSMTRSCRD